MKVRFRIKGKGFVPIMCRIRGTGLDIEFSTNIDIHYAWWDRELGRCQKGVAAGALVNTQLDNMEARVYECFTITQLQKKRLPTADEIKEKALGEFTSRVTLAAYAAGYVDRLKERSNRRTGVTIARGTWQKQLTTLEKLKAYDYVQGVPVYLITADLNFYHGFTGFLVAQNYGANTIGKILSIVRSWLREADAEGEQVHRAYQSTQWYIGRERSSHVSLSLEELQRMEDLPLSGIAEQVRDLFLIAAFTGLRYSDVNNLNDAIIRDGLIHMEQLKTRGEVVIPIHPLVQRILEKYRTAGRIIPPAVSNVVMNAELKRIAQAAGITDDVMKRTTKGGQRNSERRAKWEMVTVHTARRSFAKNLFLTGFKLEYLSRIMGHSSIDQTIEYIGLDSVEKAMLLKAHWS